MLGLSSVAWRKKNANMMNISSGFKEIWLKLFLQFWTFIHSFSPQLQLFSEIKTYYLSSLTFTSCVERTASPCSSPDFGPVLSSRSFSRTLTVFPVILEVPSIFSPADCTLQSIAWYHSIFNAVELLELRCLYSCSLAWFRNSLSLPLRFNSSGSLALISSPLSQPKTTIA